jgi:hypothetical protein
MKTTLEIPDRLFERVKAKAALEGVKIKDVVANALTGYLAAFACSAAMRLVTFDSGFRRFKGLEVLLLSQQ